jgi:hypothetical protein
MLQARGTAWRTLGDAVAPVGPVELEVPGGPVELEA